MAATQPGRPAGAPGSAAPPAPQREMYAEASTRSGGRGRSIAVAATLACLVLGALVGGVAYLLTKDDSQARADLEAGFAGGDGMPNDAADGGASSASGPSSDAPSGGQLEPEGAQGPNGLAVGRYLQAGSFRTAEAVQQEVERVRDEGIKAFVWPSERTNELLPGFQVVLIGPLAGVREERRLTRWLDGIGIVALGRDLTPSATLSGPSDVAGAWAGEFERSRLRGSRRPSSEQIVFAIDPDGRSGTVEYPERGCEGSLALVEAGSHSVTYRESIDSGACPDGWIWHLRPAGSELKATGLHDERQVMLHGTVPRG